MIRWLGAALLLMGASALGVGAAARLRGRVRDIQGLTAGLEAMARTLSASLAPLDEMLQAAEACTGQRPAQFFHTCRRELLTLGGNPFSRLWDKALRETPLRLDEGDRAVLKQVGASWGAMIRTVRRSLWDKRFSAYPNNRGKRKSGRAA